VIRNLYVIGQAILTNKVCHPGMKFTKHCRADRRGFRRLSRVWIIPKGFGMPLIISAIHAGLSGVWTISKGFGMPEQ